MNCVLMRVIECRERQYIADVLSITVVLRQSEWVRVIRSDEGLMLETSAIVSFTQCYITLINTQLIHQFVT